jgi:hypothetical protein
MKTAKVLCNFILVSLVPGEAYALLVQPILQRVIPDRKDEFEVFDLAGPTAALCRIIDIIGFYHYFIIALLWLYHCFIMAISWRLHRYFMERKRETD